MRCLFAIGCLIGAALALGYAAATTERHVAVLEAGRQ
jgi:hypothetical protein